MIVCAGPCSLSSSHHYQQFKVRVSNFQCIFAPAAAAAGLSTLVDDRCGLLTVAGGVAIGRGQAWGARDALPDTVAHVAGRGGPEPVDHELAAVPHGDVQLPHAALPVLVDARRAGHDPLGHAGDGPCNDEHE